MTPDQIVVHYNILLRRLTEQVNDAEQWSKRLDTRPGGVLHFVATHMEDVCMNLATLEVGTYVRDMLVSGQETPLITLKAVHKLAYEGVLTRTPGSTDPGTRLLHTHKRDAWAELVKLTQEPARES